MIEINLMNINELVCVWHAARNWKINIVSHLKGHYAHEHGNTKDFRLICGFSADVRHTWFCLCIFFWGARTCDLLNVSTTGRWSVSRRQTHKNIFMVKEERCSSARDAVWRITDPDELSDVRLCSHHQDHTWGSRRCRSGPQPPSEGCTALSSARPHLFIWPFFPLPVIY